MILLLCFMALGLIAQNQNYVPATLNVEEKAEANKSVFCCFAEENLEYPERSCFIGEEGIVVVQFTITEKGSVEDMKITNSVCENLDEAVLCCLEKTMGMWQPAMQDGRPIASVKKVYINFDMAGNPSHKDNALMMYKAALKSYSKGMDVESNYLSFTRQEQRKRTKFFERSLNELKEASKYAPEELPIVLWQAKAYEQLGDMTASKMKLDEYMRLLNPEETTEVEMAFIRAIK